jgi:hypothetical protein
MAGMTSYLELYGIRFDELSKRPGEIRESGKR